MEGILNRLNRTRRLWRIHRSFSTSSSVNITGRFWRSNVIDHKPTPKENVTAKVQSLIKNRHVCIDPMAVYNRVAASQPSSLSLSLLFSTYGYEAFDSVKEIIHLSNNAQLTAGSYVEFYDPLTYKLNIGMVVAGAGTRFGVDLSQATVLTVDGDVVGVDGSMVSFHLYKLWNDEEINVKDHQEVQGILNSFIVESMDMANELTLALDTMFYQLSLSHSIKGIQLHQLYDDLMKLNKEEPYEYYHQQARLLLSIHMNLCRSTNWLVRFHTKHSNLTLNQSSNLLASNSTYYVNSTRNVDSITRFVSEFPKRKTDFNNHLGYMLTTGSKGKNYETIMNYYNIWEGKPFRHLIETLKFAVVYPHPQVIIRLNKLNIFKSFGGASPTNVYHVLSQLRIYDNKANQLTDPFISANMLGEVKLSNLAASNLSELNQRPEIGGNLMEDKVSILRDKFPHLRDQVPTNDNRIYAVPLAESSSSSSTSYICLCLSTEATGLDFYIPDIASKVSPSTISFENIVSGRSLGSTIRNLPNNQEAWMIEPQVATKLGFEGSNETFRVSFRSSSKFEPLFKDLAKKVSVSLKTISSSKIRVLSLEMLQALLEKGKASAKRVGVFKQYPDLEEEDEVQLKRIYEVLHNHFVHRVKNGASPILTMDYDPSGCDGSRITIQGRINHKQLVDTEISETLSPPKSLKSEAMIFVDEVDKMLGHMLSEYCMEHEIPVIRQTQDLYLTDNSSSSSDDQAIVSHDNKYFPSFEADSYYHTLMVKNPQWSLSVSAYLIGRHFLLKPATTNTTTTTIAEPHLSLGMKHGYVNISEPLNEFSSWVNQLQLVQHLQKEYTESWTDASRFNYLIKLGYGTPIDLTQARDSVINTHLVSQYVSSWLKRYWSLKRLEQDMLTKKQAKLYHCVVTRIGSPVDKIGSRPRLCMAFCKQLDLEIELLTTEEPKIGAQLVGKEVVYLNVVEGDCIIM